MEITLTKDKLTHVGEPAIVSLIMDDDPLVIVPKQYAAHAISDVLTFHKNNPDAEWFTQLLIPCERIDGNWRIRPSCCRCGWKGVEIAVRINKSEAKLAILPLDNDADIYNHEVWLFDITDQIHKQHATKETNPTAHAVACATEHIKKFRKENSIEDAVRRANEYYRGKENISTDIEEAVRIASERSEANGVCFNYDTDIWEFPQEASSFTGGSQGEDQETWSATGLDASESQMPDSR